LHNVTFDYYCIFSEIEKPSTTTQLLFSDYEMRTAGQYKKLTVLWGSRSFHLEHITSTHFA